MRKTRTNRGIVLLMTVLVMALLVVIVIQYSYSAMVDQVRAGYHQKFLQNQLYLESAAQICMKYCSQVATDSSFTEKKFVVPLDESGEKELRIHFYDDSGKFNINSIITATSSSDRIARREQLRRLLTTIGTSSPDIVLHTQSILLNLETRQHPLQSLEELKALLDPNILGTGASSTGLSSTGSPSTTTLEGTQETINQNNSKAGDEIIDQVSRFLAVNDVTLVNLRTAPTEVIQCLDPAIDPSMAEQIRAHYTEQKAEGEIKKMAEKIDRYTTLTSTAYGAVAKIVTPEGEFSTIFRLKYVRQGRKVEIQSFERITRPKVVIEEADTQTDNGLSQNLR